MFGKEFFNDVFFLFSGEDSNGSTADQVMVNAAETNGTTTDQKKEIKPELIMKNEHQDKIYLQFSYVCKTLDEIMIEKTKRRINFPSLLKK